MRIIAGNYRSRIILEVPGESTRPTTDKNREKIFNILGQFFSGGQALDLFAGSGAMGIEALSRGIESCIFVDINHKAIATIKENLKKLGITSGVKVDQSEAMLYLKRYLGRPFDLIFLDPPYQQTVIPSILAFIDSRVLLAQDGVIVCETDRNTLLNDQYGKLIKQRETVEGISKFTFYIWEVQQ